MLYFLFFHQRSFFLRLSSQCNSHWKLTPEASCFPTIIIIKASRCSILNLFQAGNCSGLFDRFRNREPINPSITSKTYLSVADWQTFVLFCFALLCFILRVLMAGNNWDIKIIKEKTQTALYIREYHQIALSAIFLISH
jgi:hypothetical protein